KNFLALGYWTIFCVRARRNFPFLPLPAGLVVQSLYSIKGITNSIPANLTEFKICNRKAHRTRSVAWSSIYAKRRLQVWHRIS
ncbi:unnamed protein product, partial [Larinioides sclopetarius]